MRKKKALYSPIYFLLLDEVYTINEQSKLLLAVSLCGLVLPKVISACI